MRWFSVDIHRNYPIVFRNQCVKKGDGKGNVKEMLVSIELSVSWKAVTPLFIIMQHTAMGSPVSPVVANLCME